MMTRRPLILALGLMLAAFAGATPARGASKVVVKGHGFGHGIGLSQYGAYGMAKLGNYSFERILGHYYTGTSLVTVSPSPDVRVLLQSGRPSAVVSGVEQAADKNLSVDKTYTVVNAGGTMVSLRSAGGKVLLTTEAPLRLQTPAGKGFRLRGKALNGLVSGRYRGSLEVRPSATGGVNAINALGLESYLRGVISAESPASWPAAALQAQAVAARSYAITTSRSKKDGWDQYPDQRSQVYRGIQAEFPSTDAAVAATEGKVVAFGNRPVTTFFFSTSGGHTEAVQNSFLSSPSRAWLVGVPDPFDSISPVHSWTVTFTRKSITAKLRKLGLKGNYKSVKVLQRGVSPRIVRAQLVGTRGRTIVTGPQLRSALGLRDTWATFSSIGSSTTPADPAAPTPTTPNPAPPPASAPGGPLCPTLTTGGGTSASC